MVNAHAPDYLFLAEKLIKRGEGLRLKAYRDTKGIYTVGYGHNLEAYPIKGRTNLDLVRTGITQQEADKLLREDIQRAADDVQRIAPSFYLLDPLRKAVMVDMCFNLGQTRLAKFLGFLGALFVRDYKKASFEILDSQYQRDVKARAWRNAIMMATGEYLD